MTIEGNWIAGAMTHDYPTVPYKAVELPAGPAGKGTLQYDGGWGLAAASKNKADAMAAISYLTQTKVADGEREGLRRDAVGQGGREGSGRSSIRSSRRSSPVPTTRRASRRFPTSRPCSATSTSNCRDCRQSDPKPILNRVNGELQSILK